MTGEGEAADLRAPHRMSPECIRAVRGLVLGTLLGAAVHGACMVVAYGLGLYGHNALPYAIGTGAAVGAVSGLLQARWRVGAVLLAGVVATAAAAVLGGFVAWRLSTPMSFPRDHALGMDSVVSVAVFAFIAATGTVLGLAAATPSRCQSADGAGGPRHTGAAVSGGDDGAGA